MQPTSGFIVLFVQKTGKDYNLFELQAVFAAVTSNSLTRCFLKYSVSRYQKNLYFIKIRMAEI